MSVGERRLLAIAAVAVTAALGLGIGRTDLLPPDETRVAEISREMASEGNWLVPRLNGQPFLEEPPLFNWLQVGAYIAAGRPSASAARWPAMLGAVVGVLAAALLAHAVGASAAVAVLVLATAPEYWWMARSGTSDTCAAATTALALTLFFLAWQTGRRAPLVGAVLAAAAAFWLKSFLGVGLGALTAGAFVLFAGRGRILPRHLACAAAASGALAATWLLILWLTEGRDALGFFILTNHLGRLVGLSSEGHVRPFYYYAPNLALDLFPWSLALPVAVAAAWRAREQPGRAFPLVWGATMTLALTLSSSKSAHYLLAAYPAFAVLVAQWWFEPGERSLDRATVSVFGIGLAAVAAPACILLLSLEPGAWMSAAAEGHGPPALARAVLGQPIRAAAWGAALSTLLLATLCLRALRANRRGLAAAAAAAAATLVHTLVVLVVLPGFDPLSSARAWGERLARAEQNGSALAAFGFTNREALSPFMFYAGQRIVEMESPEQLEGLLDAGPACVLVRAPAYESLPPPLRHFPHAPGTVGGLAFVMVATSGAACPGVAAERSSSEYAWPG